jgi:hypothetical protein
MEFLNENWFWTGVFTLSGSFGGILIKELISNRTQLKLERIRIYESRILKANISLHKFISNVSIHYWPPEEPRSDFIGIIKGKHFEEVKNNILLYDNDVRKIIKIIENQYHCLSNTDLSPKKDFEDFYENDFFKLLGKLETMVEIKTDSILHKA